MMSAPPPAPAPELQELKKLVEDQRMAMEGLRKESAEVSAKSRAAAKRKMVEVPQWQGGAAEGPGAGRQAPMGICKPAGLIHTAMAQRSAGPRVRVALPGQGQIHTCHSG